MERNLADGEGLSGKTPAEMSVFPSNPADYEYGKERRAERSEGMA